MELQHALFDDAGEPHEPPMVDERLPEREHERLTRQAGLVLARLQEGPATNMELIPISTRFSARIHELRKKGYIIDTDYLSRDKGLTQYTLKGRRDGL